MNYEAVNRLLTSAGLFDPEEYRPVRGCDLWLPCPQIAPKSRRSIEDLVTWATAGFLGEVSCRVFELRAAELGLRKALSQVFAWCSSRRP